MFAVEPDTSARRSACHRSTLILTDLVAAGRVARGERFAFDRLFVEVDLRVGGKRVVLDRLDLTPAEDAPDRLGLWNDHAYYDTLYAHSPRLDEALAGTLADMVERRDDVYGGAGRPAPGCVVVRVLAPTTWQAREILFDSWDLLRRVLLGKPACEFRKL